MKYSVASHSHKNYVPFYETATERLVPYGKLVIQYDTNNLLVTDLYGTVHLVGNSKHFLFELEECEQGTYSEGVLQFKTINDVTVLSLSQFRFSLWDLQGTTQPLSNVNTYIGTGNTSTSSGLYAMEDLRFNLQDLADVANHSLSSSKDNWVLTTTRYNGPLYRPATSVPKDPSFRDIHYYWSLQPEASAIRYFDDARREEEKDKQIYRIPKPNENASFLYVNYDLTIAFDIQPVLSNHLDCTSKHIFNQTYSTQTGTSSTEVSSYSIDLSASTVTYIECAEVKLLELDINVPTSTQNNVHMHSVILSNFQGQLNLVSNVYLENGMLPVTFKGDVLLSIIATNYPLPKICITQKALGMS